MYHIVLFEPEIPPNTGNIIRLCANTHTQLHLIEPLGFKMQDKALRRAGLDYHEFASVKTYANWRVFKDSFKGRLFGLSTKGTRSYCDVEYQKDDGFLFGPETRGLPESVRNELGPDYVLRMPMKPDSRSLNLSNTAAIMLYEALRQSEFDGLV